MWELYDPELNAKVSLINWNVRLVSMKAIAMKFSLSWLWKLLTSRALRRVDWQNCIVSRKFYCFAQVRYDIGCRLWHFNTFYLIVWIHNSENNLICNTHTSLFTPSSSSVAKIYNVTIWQRRISFGGHRIWKLVVVLLTNEWIFNMLVNVWIS